MWYWQNNRQIDQWKKDLGNGLLPIELLISDKGAKIIQWNKDSPSTNGARTTGHPYAKKIIKTQTLYPSQKLTENRLLTYCKTQHCKIPRR